MHTLQSEVFLTKRLTAYIIRDLKQVKFVSMFEKNHAAPLRFTTYILENNQHKPQVCDEE